MKTVRRLLAVVVLIGSCHLGIAQSNSVPKFNSEAEKAAWVKEHPELLPKQEIKRQDPNVRSEQRFASDAEKQAWIEANPEKYREMIGEKGHMSTTGALRGWVKDNSDAQKNTPSSTKSVKSESKKFVRQEIFESEAEKEYLKKNNPEEFERRTSTKTNQ